jgi:hypothetical protein
LVYPAERRDIDSLATDGTLRTNTSRILARSSVDDSINKDLFAFISIIISDWKSRVLAYLDRVLVSKEMDNLKRVCDNADGHELLAVVTALHHQAIYRIDSVNNCSILERLRTAHLSTRRSTMGI